MNIHISKENINNFNKISSFLAVRDIEQLTGQELEKRCGVNKADMVILLGNSILYSIHAAAEACKSGAAEKLMISGGIGHSTGYLSENIRKSRYRDIDTGGRPEADMIKDILVMYHGVEEENIIIENRSTNCGSNAREALRTAKETTGVPESVILIQDPAMQRRTHAAFIKEWHRERPVKFINYAPFIPELLYTGNGVEYSNKDIDGLWDMKRFLSLIMGEIPRLKDDETGYGPMGSGYICHVDIPEEILSAYESLTVPFGELLRLR